MLYKRFKLDEPIRADLPGMRHQTLKQRREYTERGRPEVICDSSQNVAVYNNWCRCGVDGTRYVKIARFKIMWAPQVGDLVGLPCNVLGQIAQIRGELLDIYALTGQEVRGQLLTQDANLVQLLP